MTGAMLEVLAQVDETHPLAHRAVEAERLLYEEDSVAVLAVACVDADMAARRVVHLQVLGGRCDPEFAVNRDD